MSILLKDDMVTIYEKKKLKDFKSLIPVDVIRNGSKGGDRYIHMRATAAGILDKMDEVYAKDCFKDEYAKRKLKVLVGQDPDNDNVEFRGGTYEELKGKPNMDMYHKIKKEILSTKSIKKLDTKLSTSRLRKRSRSDYDGDYDMDKKWDTKPFYDAKKSNTKIKIVDLVVNMGFSGGVDSKTIQRYGAFMAAIVNILESKGVLVKLTATKATTEFKKGSDDFNLFEIMLKEPDQYLSPSTLVKVFSSNFYRRAGFFSTILASETLEGRLEFSTMGIPVRFKQDVHVEDGKVYVLGTSVGEDRGESLVKDILKCLGEEK